MVISKVEMTLAKVDLQIAEHYVRELTQPEDQERFQVLFEQISQEFYTTSEIILTITGHRRLLDGDPDLQRSVHLRNGTIVPLGFIQVALLKRLRHYRNAISGVMKSRYSREELLRGALLTINGIAAGMRNTGWFDDFVKVCNNLSPYRLQNTRIIKASASHSLTFNFKPIFL